MSADGSMVMLTFPTEMITGAKHDMNALAPLRVPFREFAVASEAVFGGLWTTSGQAALLARNRSQPFDILPPLRFETFALLAEQSTDELSQSYERNTIFAGKLYSGEYPFKDWAPVYLSEPLIDTEFGALLNITDQMLKSWSEAGSVEYLYFTYPKPSSFPFGRRALSDILQKKNGASSVLFNWNTAGSAVILKEPALAILTVKQTGALPVTYGANGKGRPGAVHDLLDYEERAYTYFAGLQDPNLARVVQYTLIYQLFRAIAKSNPDSPGRVSPAQLDPNIQARVQATRLLAFATWRLLQAIDTGTLQEPRGLINGEVKPELAAFHSKRPDIDNQQLARILADRFSPEARQLQARQNAELQGKALDLENDDRALDHAIDTMLKWTQPAQVQLRNHLPNSSRCSSRWNERERS
jgi:hypothetical protein